LVLEAEPVGAAAPRVMIAWRDPYLSVPAPRGGEPVMPAATARGMRRRLVGHASDPAISVLMPVHDPPPEFLERAIESVREQTYARWQLCIVDDGSSDPGVVELLESQAAANERILLRRHERAGGISSATNAALSMATGEFVALVDHDDELEPDALDAVIAHLSEHPETDIVYTDEDRILANGKRLGAVLKPDWSPELLRAGMYTCHLGVYRRRLVEEVGGFRSEFDGSQDFDLMLRLVEATQRIGHVPRVLYHWRASDASVAINPMAKPYAYDAGRRAVQSHLERTGVAGEAHRSGLPGLYRVTHRVDPTTPVSIILAADRADEHTLAGVRRCAQAIAERTAHPSWELLWVCPESLAEAAAGVTPAAGEDRVRRVVPPGSAARSAMIEHAVRAATGEHVVLLDAPCEPLVEEWLGVLLGFSVQEGVAAVGAKVLSPNGSIEHGGVVIGGGLPLPAYRGVRSDYVGYLGTLAVPSNYSAVAGIVMTRRELFLRLAGLRPHPPLLAEADYCLRARLTGLRTVFAPDAALALVDPSAARPAPVADLAAFKQTWLDAVPRDPYYHPQFWQQRASFPGPSPVRAPAGAPQPLEKEASALPGVS
jgi:GT2 family glycosyltransferase